MQIFIMHFRNEDYFQVVNLASMTTKILKVSINCCFTLLCPPLPLVQHMQQC